MRTLYRILVLIVILILAACAPNAPVAPQPEQPAAPTATAAPVEPTDTQPAPTVEPSAEPTAAAPANDLSDYNLSVRLVESPDQAWEVEAVRGEVTSRNPEAQDYNRITAARKDGTLRWVFEEYTNHGMGEGLPGGFTFSADGTYLYFYDTITPDGGCGVTYTGNLRRMDLASGAVAPVEGFEREGRFSLAPDGLSAAEVEESQVVLTNLESGEQRAVPFELPFGGDVGHGDLLWSQDGQWLAFNLINNYAKCDARPELLDTLVVDLAAGSAKLLGSSENIAGAIRWVEPGQLLVQTGRDNLSKINAQTGQSEEFPLDRDELMAQMAETGLRAFLNSLYQGRFDPAHYETAANVFGSWDLLTTRYATMRFTDNAAMLRYACEEDQFRCYPVRQIVLTGKEPGANGANLYRFQVEFLNLDGTPLVVNGQSIFDFTMEMNFPERAAVFQMPPLDE